MIEFVHVPSLSIKWAKAQSLSTTEKYDIGQNAILLAEFMLLVLPTTNVETAVPAAKGDTRVDTNEKTLDRFSANPVFYGKGRVGVEPTHDGFAIRCLSHLAIPPDH